MPKIKEKSEEYLVAAQTLINCRSYNPSVHCSYYSRLLQMKYILAHHQRSISYDIQNQKREGDSHLYILEQINNRIGDSRKGTKICQYFRYLKDLRVEADYREKLFTDIECLDVKEVSEGLKKKLNDQFGVL